jgi:hypothetical protein
MSIEYRHRRYFRIRFNDNSLYNFISISDANTKIDFKPCWATSNPKKIEELADLNQTFMVTYEFNNDAEQIAFKKAIDSAWNVDTSDDSIESALLARMYNSNPWKGNSSTQIVEQFKTEWLNADGSISSTFDLDLSKFYLSGGMRGGRFVIDF